MASTTAEGIDALRAGRARAPARRRATVRQIAVPTTLSAGEFSAISGVTNEATKVKEMLRHPRIIPVAVVLDPALTRHTPEWLFLSTGIRAVDHCVEGICSAEAHPFADAQALRGLSLLVDGLQAGEGRSRRPRRAAGLPAGVLAVDGAAGDRGADGGEPWHRLCARRGLRRAAWPYLLHHAAGGDALEPRRRMRGRQALVAAAMGAPGAEAGDLLDAFIGGLGMPRSLAAVQIGRDAFPRIAEAAMATPWVPRNPRPIAGPAQVMEILELAA